jgi:hypothetical protein
MSSSIYDKDGRKNSLEEELANEDLMIDAGRVSREKRMDAKEEKARQQAADRQADMKAEMLKAARASQERRKKNKQ